MRTTLNIDSELLAKAMELSGITKKTALIESALKHLISIEAGKRLAKLGGTMLHLKIPHRRNRQF